MPTFAPGTVVRLISGGPAMTVEFTQENTSDGRPLKEEHFQVHCVWFAGEEAKDRAFSASTLVGSKPETVAGKKPRPKL